MNPGQQGGTVQTMTFGKNGELDLRCGSRQNTNTRQTQTRTHTYTHAETMVVARVSGPVHRKLLFWFQRSERERDRGSKPTDGPVRLTRGAPHRLVWMPTFFEMPGIIHSLLVYCWGADSQQNNTSGSICRTKEAQQPRKKGGGPLGRLQCACRNSPIGSVLCAVISRQLVRDTGRSSHPSLLFHTIYTFHNISAA
jgi:hypothetical protein